MITKLVKAVNILYKLVEKVEEKYGVESTEAKQVKLAWYETLQAKQLIENNQK